MMDRDEILFDQGYLHAASIANHPKLVDIFGKFLEKWLKLKVEKLSEKGQLNLTLFYIRLRIALSATLRKSYKQNKYIIISNIYR